MMMMMMMMPMNGNVIEADDIMMKMMMMTWGQRVQTMEGGKEKEGEKALEKWNFHSDSAAQSFRQS